MFEGKNRLVVVWIDAGVAVTPLFKVDVSSLSEGVRLRTQTFEAKANDHIKGIKKLQPLNLLANQKLSHKEIF